MNQAQKQPYNRRTIVVGGLLFAAVVAIGSNLLISSADAGSGQNPNGDMPALSAQNDAKGTIGMSADKQTGTMTSISDGAVGNSPLEKQLIAFGNNLHANCAYNGPMIPSGDTKVLEASYQNTPTCNAFVEAHGGEITQLGAIVDKSQTAKIVFRTIDGQPIARVLYPVG